MGDKYACRRYRRKLKQRAGEIVGSVCCFCGSADKLEYAHVLPTKLSGSKGRGQTHRLLDVIRHPLYYRRMCHECHTRYDHECERSAGNDADVPF